MNNQRKTLLLHICCAPDSTVVVERFRGSYDITGFFYNPNIHPEEEYNLRSDEMRRTACYMGFPLETGPYDADRWFSLTKGMEQLPEGGERCVICFRMRLEETAKLASKMNFSLFATVLSVSPHKNVSVINKIGEEIAQKYRVAYLPENFKKKDGFKRSIELSKIYNLYRQDYCGCTFSRR